MIRKVVNLTQLAQNCI